MTVLDRATRFTEPAQSRRTRRWVIAIVVLLVLGAAGYVVWFSSLLSVREVRVLGAVHVSAESVLQLAAVPADQQLARINAAAIASRVGTLPRVESVEVRRGWPSTLVIVITERKPVAVVPDGAGFAYVDAPGIRFDNVAKAPKGMSVIRARDQVSLATAIAIITGLPADWKRQVPLVVATSRDNVVLQWPPGSTVQWGSAERMDMKISVLRALLPQRARRYDVSAPDLPTTSTR